MVPVAAKHNLGQGWSLDLSTQDSLGRAWDFDNDECRRRAIELVDRTKPLLLILSPMCRFFSVLQRINRDKQDPAKFEENRARAVRHLEFCLILCKMQQDGGRRYLLEQPAQATSWQEPSMIEFIAKSPDARIATCDLCCYGLKTLGTDGSKRLAKKPTRFLTNSACLFEALGVRCEGGAPPPTINWRSSFRCGHIPKGTMSDHSLRIQEAALT